MKIVLISDTHCKWNRITIPECDLLISAGDYSFRGEEHVVRDFHKWLSKQPAKHIISVQGNHELGVERNFAFCKQIAEKACPGVHFIDEGPIEIEGKKIWCSAITPFFCNWAWNRYPGEEIQKHWDRIPDGMDIIVTHGPCKDILDGIPEFNRLTGQLESRHVGCPQLLKRVLEVKPKLHVGGHIHEGYGTHTQDGIVFVNASICNAYYKPTNKPIIFEI
jgi:Icc-related predicted phosphoesterase